MNRTFKVGPESLSSISAMCQTRFPSAGEFVSYSPPQQGCPAALGADATCCTWEGPGPSCQGYFCGLISDGIMKSALSVPGMGTGAFPEESWGPLACGGRLPLLACFRLSPSCPSSSSGLMGRQRVASPMLFHIAVVVKPRW